MWIKVILLSGFLSVATIAFSQKDSVSVTISVDTIIINIAKDSILTLPVQIENNSSQSILLPYIRRITNDNFSIQEEADFCPSPFLGGIVYLDIDTRIVYHPFTFITTSNPLPTEQYKPIKNRFKDMWDYSILLNPHSFQTYLFNLKLNEHIKIDDYEHDVFIGKFFYYFELKNIYKDPLMVEVMDRLELKNRNICLISNDFYIKIVD